MSCSRTEPFADLTETALGYFAQRALCGRFAPGELILPKARSLVAGLELTRGSSVA